MIEFWVDGTPISQGSMKVINGHVIHSQGSALAVWRSSIALAARFAGVKKIENAVAIEMDFIFKKPKTVKRTYPTVPIDADKAARAVNDSLTGIAYNDDAQIVDMRVSKRYGENPGVRVRLFELY